jgi:two-component system sensor histidine kinase BaeS
MGRVIEWWRSYRMQVLRPMMLTTVLLTAGLVALFLAVAVAALVGRSGWVALVAGREVLVLNGEVLFALGSTLLASVIVAFEIGRRLLLRKALPLLLVEEVARAIAEGRYETRIELPPRAAPFTRALAGHLNRLADSLVRVEKARRDMVTNLAHELRTPLTNVQGYLEALRDGVIEANEASLGSVHEEVLRLSRLLEGIHQLARVDAVRALMPTRQPTDLDRVAAEILAVISPTCEARGLRVRTNWGAGARLVTVHADSMAQVLRNLIRNAVTYTDEGGMIQLHTTLHAGTYRFVCLNSGPGIGPEDLPHVFKRFYRPPNSALTNSTGVGVGLAIVKELVEAHGGRIGVESKNGWTTFWFELPEAQQGVAS